MFTKTKLLIFAGIGAFAFLLALIAGYFLLFGGGQDTVTPPPRPANITLEMWGLFDDSDVYEPIIEAYMADHPRVTIRYTKLLWDEYEDKLVNAIASGRGPDIFMIHNSWMDKHLDKLAPADNAIPYPFITETGFRQKNIYAYPLFIDNLALFYNKDLLLQENFLEPPRTWEEFNDYTKALTRFSSTGSLIRSGAALGGDSQTINRATDILLLFLMQNGVQPINKKTNKVDWKDDTERFAAARDALRFYTDFTNPSKGVYSWDEGQHYSLDAFWEGRLAMMFNYAYNIETIKQKAPYLNFEIAPLPQKGAGVTIGNFWGLAVSARSNFTREAWDFLKFFGAAEQYEGYIERTGRIAAKDEVMARQKDDPLLKPFIEQIYAMTTPYQPNERKMQDILDEMIRKVNKGEFTVDEALHWSVDKFEQLIK